MNERTRRSCRAISTTNWSEVSGFSLTAGQWLEVRIAKNSRSCTRASRAAQIRTKTLCGGGAKPFRKIHLNFVKLQALAAARRNRAEMRAYRQPDSSCRKTSLQ